MLLNQVNARVPCRQSRRPVKDNIFTWLHLIFLQISYYYPHEQNKKDRTLNEPTQYPCNINETIK